MAAPAVDMELMRPAILRRPKWNPKRWHPMYEEVVMMDHMGYKNIEIARLKGITKEHVSNILNTDQAKALRELIVLRLRDKGTSTLEARLERAADKAMSRIEEVINDDEYAEGNKGGIFDRSLKLLQATKKVAKTDSPDVTNNILIPAGALLQLKEAVAASDAVRARHQLSEAEGEGVNTLR